MPLSKKELLLRMINRVGHRKNRILCPICEQEKDYAILGIWIAPDLKTLVCTYGVCEECANRTMRLPQSMQGKMGDKCEDELLRRYPELKNKLPP